MWTKIFRSKSNKYKSRDDIPKSPETQGSSGHRSKLAKVVNSFTLKRHSRDGTVTRVNLGDFERREKFVVIDTSSSSTQKADQSSELETSATTIETDLSLEPCPICTRTFAPKTLKKHVLICEKSVVKKRRIFDSSRQRREGTDLADFLPKNFGLPPAKQDPKIQPIDKSSRQISYQVTTPILQKRENEPIKSIAPGKKLVLPTPTASTSPPKEKPKPVLSRLAPTAEPCPFCGRSFGTKAYDRHVEWCKEKTRISHPQQNSSVNVAKERLQARTKYRAPCLKTKRAVNREKYSGFSCEESTNSLSDGGSNGSGAKLKEFSHDSRGNMEISMTSSVMSSSIMSDGDQCTEKDDQSKTTNSKYNRNSKQMVVNRCSRYEKSDKYENVEAQYSTLTLPESDHTENPVSIEIKSSKVVNCNSKTAFNSLEDLQISNYKTSKIPTKFKGSENCAGIGPRMVDIEYGNYSVEIDNQNHNIKQNESRTSLCLTDEEHIFSSRSASSKRIKNNPASKTNNSNSPQLYAKQENRYVKIEYKGSPDMVQQKKTKTSLKFPAKCRIELDNENANHSPNEVVSAEFINFKKIRGPRPVENESNESIRTLNSRTSFSDISSNDLTFSYEEEIVSENEENKISHCERNKLEYSPSKSYTIRALSDKYDPFLSAKRQLEELCSPINSNVPAASLPTTPNVKTNYESLMSKSCIANSTNKLSSVKSNFTRTSSLRVPRKTTPTRTLFATGIKQKPTIQRGISDEGPISSNFLKPEEYDEMPVKSVCINDFATSRHPDSHSTPKIIKRDPTTIRTRRNLKMNLASIGKKDTNPLSKTDSLAIFLHYENATRVTDIPINLTEKDLKDKSNNLSKQTSSKSSASDLDCMLSEKDKLSSLKNSLSCLLDPNNSSFDKHLIQDTNPIAVTKVQAIKLEPLPKFLPKIEKTHFTPFPVSSKEDGFIDPKLINVCDNLPINVTKLSDNDLTSSSTESMTKTAMHAESNFEFSANQEDSLLDSQIQHRNSTEKKNLLKRQLRLGKNHFLYDLSPENDNYSVDCDKDICGAEIDSNKLDSSVSTIDPVPDEFDIEEFISSFENADDYPLFKDYKAFLSTRSLNKTSNNSRESSRSPVAANIINNDEDDHDKEKNEIFSSNESFLRHESSSVPYNTSYQTDHDPSAQNVTLNDLNRNERSRPSSSGMNVEVNEEDEEEIETNIVLDTNENYQKIEKLRDLERFESPEPRNDVTDHLKSLSKPSSLESLEIKKSVSSKQSADSAYGSLSRHSPVDRISRRSSALRSSFPNTPDELQPKKRNLHIGLDTKRRSRDISNDSSSSELSSHDQSEKNHGNQRTADNISVQKDMRMSKFCHECGSKFLISHAKFCMECGVKRIIIE